MPFIVRWPGRIEAGSESDHPSAFWDFLPTVTEIAGADTPDDIDGISFLPTLLGEKQKEHEYLYWEFTEQGGKQAVRLGKWKGVRTNVSRNPDSKIELYNLEEDIAESNNIAGNHPDIVNQIDQIMKTARTESQEYPLFG